MQKLTCLNSNTDEPTSESQVCNTKLLIRCFFKSKSIDTDNPLYTDIRYNDKICYNDNLTDMKPLLNR